MAYQPIRYKDHGTGAEISTGAVAITLATAGVSYVMLSTQYTTPLPAFPYEIYTERCSVMTMSNKEVEWRFVGWLRDQPSIVLGDELVYSQLNIFSVQEGAVGNGTQILIGGIDGIDGAFVPPADERGGKFDETFNELPSPVPFNAVGYLVARPMVNNATVVARCNFRERELLNVDTVEIQEPNLNAQNNAVVTTSQWRTAFG